MSQAERDFIRQVDDLVLNASPSELAKIAELDKKSQLDGKTFYDVYSALSDNDRKQIHDFVSIKKR